MAQTGYTPISLYYSTTAAAVPTAGNLANGELAINITDGKLYYKNNSGVVTLLAGATSGPAGGSNTQVQYNSSGVLAGSANMTFDGTTLTAGGFTTTGITSTNNLTASGSVTLSGGTANGVAYLNGSKVVTSGSALTFDGTNFATTGSGTLKNLLFSGGTLPAAGNPSIALRSSDNVIYHQSGSGNTIVLLDSAQNTMQSISATANIFNISNTEQMRLTSTGLGIGTNSPAAKLDIYQSSVRYVRAYPPSGLADLEVVTNNNSQPVFAVKGTGTADLIRAYAGATQAITLNSSGNLGVGVTSPASKLDIFPTFSGSTGTTLGDTAYADIYARSGGYLNQYGQICFGYTGNYATAAIGFLPTLASGNTKGDLVFATRDVTTDTAPTERFRIASNGAWGLAGANYGTAGQVLTSNGSGAAPSWQAGGGGGGSPGGSNTQVQYNSSGSFAGSANFTFNGTGITTGNVNVTSSTNPTAGMYYNSTATSGLSFYNTGASGGSSAMQIYYGRSTMSATTGGISNPDSQWYAFGSGQTPSLTIGSTASLYYFTGHSYRLDEVPYLFRIRGGGRGDNGNYTVPESNGILFIDLADDYGGNGSEGRNCIYVNNRTNGFGQSTNGVKVINNSYARQNAFYALLKIGDPNGGGSNFGYYAQIDTSAGANDNASPVGLVIDNALVNNYTKTNGGAQLAIFYDRRDGSTARTAIQFYRNTTSNSVGTITTTNTATAYNTSSDYRLKENIAPLTGAIEKVLRLKPSTYTWKVDGSAGEGFIAHELQEVIPQAVSGEKDAEKLQQVEVEHAVPEVQDADGNIISHGKAPVYEERMMPVYQGVDSSFLVATLTAAIQEQQALIVALTARVAALEAK